MNERSNASPDEVLITPELDRRPVPPPDAAGESRALLALAREMTTNPRGVPQKLAELAAELCRVETAGISLLKAGNDGEHFRWVAVVGPLAPRAGSLVPRAGSPCGATLDRKAPQLFSRPTHYFAGFDGTPVGEGLVVPLAADGAAAGTVWVVAHDRERRFDAGDVRVLTTLAAFTAAAIKTVSSLDAERAAQATVASENAKLLQAVEREIAERTRVEEALRRSERELADFFESAALGMHWVGPDGIILRANRAELGMLGYSREEYVGHHVAEFHADGDLIEGILNRLRAGETIDNVEVRLRCKDGSLRHVLISSNVLWEGGRFVHTRCFTRDITDRKRAEEELREVARRKDEFLAILAHELRNPLAPIRNAIHVMRLGGPGAAERALEMIERQHLQLVRLVDDLLDVSRITRGKLILQPERVDLAAVVRTAVETSQPLVESAGHELTVVLPPEPVYLDADPARLAQVFANLLNNAAKYTDRGGRIRLTVERRDAGVAVAVTDTGVGIPEEMLSRVFDMFTQAGRSLDRAQGGLGIGLTLVKRLVEMHAGTIEAKSGGPGRGSEFVVRLPVAEAVTPARGGTLPTAVGDELRPPVTVPARRVLVVDDNRDAADSLGMMLSLMGHEVGYAYDGLGAVETALAFRPDVVICDIGLPGIDGYEVARRLRAEPGTANSVLAALTGWGQEEDRRRSYEAGFNAHLVKPVVADAIRAILTPGRAWGQGHGENNDD